jgi:hypothetical protein
MERHCNDLAGFEIHAWFVALPAMCLLSSAALSVTTSAYFNQDLGEGFETTRRRTLLPSGEVDNCWCRSPRKETCS